MSEMIEQVAKAIFDADDEGSSGDIFKETRHSGDCIHEAHTCLVCLAEIYREMARAALQAMRKRTEAMKNAGLVPWNDAVESAHLRGLNKVGLGRSEWWMTHSDEAWQASIDEALGK